MEEKKYLKWYNKVGYGSGDIAGNVVYAFLTSFVMGIPDGYGRTCFRHCRHTDRGIQIIRWIYGCIFRIPD